MGMFSDLFGSGPKSKLEESDDEDEEPEEDENMKEDETTEEDEQLYEVEIYIREGDNLKLPHAVKERAEKWAKDILNQIEENKKWIIIEIPETEDKYYSYDAVLASDIQYIDVSRYNEDDEDGEE